MGRETIEGIFSVAIAIVGVGMIAVLVSRNANTAGILAASGQALATGLQAAELPVTASSGWTGGAPLDLSSF
jgi:PRD1 phage membrane DNA delivery